MIDPVTAMSVAVNAFGTIKRMVAAGKEVEDTLSQIGRFYGAVSDLSEHRRQADNPPLFKKIIAAKSVNEEAMETYARTKRTQQMERELRELLMYQYGPRMAIRNSLISAGLLLPREKRPSTCKKESARLYSGIVSRSLG